LKPPSQEQKDLVFNRLGNGNEVQSSIPSRMKQFSTLNVKTDGSLRVKMHTVMFKGQPAIFNSNKEREKQEVNSHHITIRECQDPDPKIELAETPKTLEDGGQVIVD